MPTDAFRTASHRVGDTRVAQRELVAPSHHRDGPHATFKADLTVTPAAPCRGCRNPAATEGHLGTALSPPAPRRGSCSAQPVPPPAHASVPSTTETLSGPGRGGILHEKTRLCDHNRAPLCPGPPPQRGVGWGAAQTDVKAWGEHGADVRVALSTNKSLVMPSRLGGGPQGGGCTRVLIRCRLGTVLPGGLVLS